MTRRSDALDPVFLKEIKERVGETIQQRWRLEKLLGVGASAAVYKAADQELGREVAIKIMHQRFTHSEIVRKRFLRERDILLEIQHRNVLQIYESGESDRNEPFITMELLNGRTLAQIMRRRDDRPMPIPFVLGTMEQVLSVLALCHSQDIVHRDLKPGNIFLTRDHEIKVLDFGVARFHTDGMQLTRDGTALGTPAFMSPEQAMGQLDMLDARSDIFSVGGMMHFLLSGSYLHQGRTQDETFVMAASTPAPSLARRAPDLPAPLIQLVDCAVAWDRDDRWQSASEMLAQLRLLDEEGQTREAPRTTPAAPQHAISAQQQQPQAPSLAQAVYQSPEYGNSSRFGQLPQAHNPNMSSFGAQPGAVPMPQRQHAMPRPQRSPDQSMERGQVPRVSHGHDPNASSFGARPVWAHTPVFGAQAIQGDVSSFGPTSHQFGAEPAPGHTAEFDAVKRDREHEHRVNQTQPLQSIQGNPNMTGSIPRMGSPRAHQQLGYLVGEFFSAFGAALELGQQYGKNHPELIQRLDRAFTHLQSALQTHRRSIGLRVRPFSLALHEPHVLWEPSSPLDLIPHALYGAGVRLLRFMPELRRSEFIRFSRLLMPEPGTRAPATEELAGALWDARLMHIEHQLVTSFQFSTMDEHQAFRSAYDEQVESITENLKRGVVEALERRQILMSMGKSAMAEAEARRFSIDQRESAITVPLPASLSEGVEALQRAHSQQAQDWVKRVSVIFGDMVVEGFAQHDEDELLASFAALTRRYLEEERVSELLGLYGSTINRLQDARHRAKLTRTLFDTQTLGRLLELAVRAPRSTLLVNGLKLLLRELDADFMSAALNALREPRQGNAPQHDELTAALVGYIRQHMRGFEVMIARSLPELPRDMALELLPELERGAGSRALDVLSPVAGHPDPYVRLTALERVAAHGALRTASPIVDLLVSPDGQLRQRAMMIASSHPLPDLNQALLHHAQQPGFPSRPAEEQRATLDLLSRVDARTAEQFAISLLHTQHGQHQPALHTTRALAAELLGYIASTEAAMQALEVAASPHPWNAPNVQNAALQARHNLMTRRQHGHGGGA